MSVNYYSIEDAFNEIENELLTDLRKRLQKGIPNIDNIDEAYKIWQVEQLKGLQQFRYIDDKDFVERFSQLNDKIEQLLDESYTYANEEEARSILTSLSNRISKSVNADELLLLNKNKLKALINATTNDIKRAEYATLRMCDDQYRKIIYNTQLYLGSGSGTLRSAIDRAKNQFYEAGIQSVQYKNGANVNISSYTEMALRTSNKRATLQGEAAARDEYGLNLVIITRRGTACPKCQRFCGRVCVDNVYGSVQNENSDIYPLLSDFIAGGLYHPNCKDSHSTYYPGISSKPRPMTQAEQERATEIYNLEQKQRYNERQIRKYKRLAENQLDPANADKYDLKVKEWQARQREFIKSNGDALRRKYDRESIN